MDADAGFLKQKEPHVSAYAALWSPDTGIVEAEALVKALEHLVQAARRGDRGRQPAAGCRADRGWHRARHARTNASWPAPSSMPPVCMPTRSRQKLGGMTFRIYPCRGEYAELAPSRRHMVNGLVYPLPHHSGAGLGVHLAKTTWGTVTLGPTIHYQESRDDYEGGRITLEEFVAAGAKAPAVGHAGRPAAGRQRHSREAAGPWPAGCGFPDSARRGEPARDPGGGHRFARTHVVSRDWQSRGRDLGRLTRLAKASARRFSPHTAQPRMFATARTRQPACSTSCARASLRIALLDRRGEAIVEIGNQAAHGRVLRRRIRQARRPRKVARRKCAGDVHERRKDGAQPADVAGDMRADRAAHRVHRCERDRHGHARRSKVFVDVNQQRAHPASASARSRAPRRAGSTV